MALKQSLEKNGNVLFRYRGQIPLFVFILGLPFIYFTYFTDNYKLFSQFFGSGLSCFWTTISILSIVVSLLGIVTRAYTIGTTPRGTSGRNREKQVANQLNTKGIYSVVRHPLYVGNYLMWAGLLIFVANIYLFIIAFCYIGSITKGLCLPKNVIWKTVWRRFYSMVVESACFCAGFQQFEKGDIPFSFKSVLRREYSGAFAITLCFTLVDYIRYYAITLQDNIMQPQWIRLSLLCLAVMAVLTIVLRTLKHYTPILNRAPGRD